MNVLWASGARQKTEKMGTGRLTVPLQAKSICLKSYDSKDQDFKTCRLNES